MPIDGVQNYNITARNGSLSNVIAGTVLGGVMLLNTLFRLILLSVLTFLIALSSMSQEKKPIKKWLKTSMRTLEASKPDVAKEFKKIVKVADKDSSAVAKQYAGAYHRFLKCLRPNAQFVGVGAAVGFLGGVLYNVFTHDKA